MTTIFTRIIHKEIPSYIVAENDIFLAFLDAFPLVEGHVLVIPKKEIDYIFDLDDELLSKMMIFAKEVARKMKMAIPCKKIGIAVIGLEVPHAHIHLVPLQQVSDLNFTKVKLTLSKEKMLEIQNLILHQI